MVLTVHKRTYVKIFVLLFASLGFLLSAPLASADGTDGPFISKTQRDQMIDHQQLLYTLACLPTTTMINAEFAFPGDPPMEEVGTNDMVFASNDQLKNKKYLDQGVLSASVSRGSMYDNGALPCDGGQDFGFVWPFAKFGKGNLVDFFCTLPGVYHNLTGGKGKTIAGGSNKAACVAGSKFTNGKSFFVAKSGTNLQAQAKAELEKTSRGKIASKPLTPAKKYIQYWLTFSKVCGATLTTPYPKDSDPAANNGSLFRIPVVNKNGKVVDYLANTGGDSTDGKKVMLDANDPYPGSTTCGNLAVGMRDTSNAYANYLKGPGKDDEQSPDGTGIDEHEPEDEEEITGTSCDIDGIGWLICPVMNFLAKANEQAFRFIESLLGVRPGLVQDDATVAAWERFRDIANVAFVIAFMVIIYSQITSMGISNYGLKKLLPKIAVAAILVNLSLFICQILVDFSNIAGHSLYSFITNISPVPPGAENDGTWTSLMLVVLAGGAIVLLVVILFLAPTVLLAVGMILLILVARQAFILILIIISPLAFVAYLLPNTEGLFKKWWKMLSAMLLVYPIIAVVFGASVLASNILMRIASQDGNIASEGTEDNKLLAIVALGVMAIPLFAVPGLLKGAMNGAGAIGAKLQGYADKSQSRSGAKIKARGKEKFDNSLAGQYMGYRQGVKKDRDSRIRSGAYRGRGGNLNPRNWKAGANRLINNNSGGFGAERDLQRQAQDRKDQKDTIDMFGGDYDLAIAWAQHGGRKVDDTALTASGLNAGQIAQYNRMRSAGHNRKPASHLATAQFLAETGQGSSADVISAINAAQAAGANDTDIGTATQTAIGTYRANGRGDAVAELSTYAGNPMTNQDGWAQVDPSKIHRAGLSQDIAGYQAHLASSPDTTRKALAGFDRMESRARNIAESEIIAAAQIHEYNATGITPTISTIQDAKTYFSVV